MSPILETAAIGEIIKLALSITDKVLARMPNYTQSKKEKFYKLKKAYESEMSRAYPLKDDNLCGIYLAELKLFLATFNVELDGVDKINEKSNS